MPVDKVHFITVEQQSEGQRLDNFLLKQYKGVPKSHLYRVLRQGQVRINGKRVKAHSRLQSGDQIRMPPLTQRNKKPVGVDEREKRLIKQNILYEDEHLMVVNKPAKMAVHGGSKVSYGVIEIVRALYPDIKGLQLAHRLDRETSGCLVIAKDRLVLNEIQALFKHRQVTKIYHALTKGHWKTSELKVSNYLNKNQLQGGERVKKVDDGEQGRLATTQFKPLDNFTYASLVEARIATGRTHQIRVHAQQQNHPIAGDDKYGDPKFNEVMKKQGLKRLFLHAARIEFFIESLNRTIRVQAPLDPALVKILQRLEQI